MIFVQMFETSIGSGWPEKLTVDDLQNYPLSSKIDLYYITKERTKKEILYHTCALKDSKFALPQLIRFSPVLV